MVEKYAIINNGGKQYRVVIGQKVKLELMDADVGETIKFDSVLAIGSGSTITLGEPTIDSAVVEAEVIGHGRHDKINIIKFKRRKHYMKRAGHRQNFTEVKVTNINN
ncbi:MAG: 50S ribosomal protein L21 [Legionellales bacterium]|nr:50S ribosomal protein L21 [Legionellales bacterium]